MILPVLLLFFLGLYFLLIWFCSSVWIKKSNRAETASSKKSPLFFSIIIPFKNDGEALSRLLYSLKKQTYFKQNYEVILVDDNSEESNSILHNLDGEFDFKFLNLKNTGKQGKKQAINLGIQHAKGEYVITLDADTYISSYKYLEVLNSLLLERLPDLLIGPVLIKGKGILGGFQYLESLAILGITGASAKTGIPVSCSGANLVFKRSRVKNDYLNRVRTEIASGDDIFLMESIKKTNNNKIIFSKSEELLVNTNSEKTFKKFLHQRIRWSSKAKHYKSKEIIYVNTILFLGNLSFIALLIFDFISGNKPLLYLAFMLKVLPDLVLINMVAKNYKEKQNLSSSFIVSIIYFFYLICIVISNLFISEYTWKGKVYTK